MRLSIHRKLILLTTCLFAGASAWGQQSQTQSSESPVALDVAVVYNPLSANAVGGHQFWMQGGSIQALGQFWPGLHGQFWRRLGVVADVSGFHVAQISASRPGLDLVTASLGPRYTWSAPRHRYDLFGQILVGGASGMNSVFPTSTGTVASANSVALYMGVGANIRLSPRIAVRAFEADWLFTQTPNGITGVQNSLRLGMGLTYKFK